MWYVYAINHINRTPTCVIGNQYKIIFSNKIKIHNII